LRNWCMCGTKDSSSFSTFRDGTCGVGVRAKGGPPAAQRAGEQRAVVPASRALRAWPPPLRAARQLGSRGHPPTRMARRCSPSASGPCPNSFIVLSASASSTLDTRPPGGVGTFGGGGGGGGGGGDRGTALCSASASNRCSSRCVSLSAASLSRLSELICELRPSVWNRYLHAHERGGTTGRAGLSAVRGLRGLRQPWVCRSRCTTGDNRTDHARGFAPAVGRRGQRR